MSRVLVVGATGHVGTYLVPRLVRGGHEVLALSRGERERYSSLDALHESLRWLAANGHVDVGGQDF